MLMYLFIARIKRISLSIVNHLSVEKKPKKPTGSPLDSLSRWHSFFFFEAEESQIRYLRAILVLFKVVSRLKIHLAKSSIYAVNEVQDIKRLEEFWEVKLGNYLWALSEI